MRSLLRITAIVLMSSCGSGAPNVAPAAKLSPIETSIAKLIRHNVIVDGHSLALWEKSPANPRGALVLVHGRTWSSLPDFDLQVPGESHSLMDALAKEGYATFALDQRGYGATSRDATGWLTPDRAAADLAEVLRWVGARTGSRPALLGWSYGSMVSQLCAQRNADLISALILYGYPRAIDSTYSAGAAEDVSPARKHTTAEGAAEDFIVEGVSPAMVKTFVQEALSKDPIRVDWHDLEQFNALRPEKVHTPTLLMHGEHDPYAPAVRQAAIFAGLATGDRRWVILPGGDHAAHLEGTGRLFVQVLVEFLSRPSST
jgi:pimeloyl-ACP methyl ester carboxylesterase